MIVNALPKDWKKYSIRFEKKKLGKVIRLIYEIREKTYQKYGEKISRNGFDHLIWYFHKGRSK